MKNTRKTRFEKGKVAVSKLIQKKSLLSWRQSLPACFLPLVEGMLMKRI